MAASYAVLGIALLVTDLVWMVVDRLYLSPLAKFPGPKLAALTFWYEFYFDVIQRGRYTWEIGQMHDKYGQSNCAFLQCVLPIIILQGRSSASIRTSSIWTTQNSTTNCTHARPSGGTSGPGRPRYLATPSRCSALYRMINTGYDAPLSTRTSPSGLSCGWSPRSDPL